MSNFLFKKAHFLLNYFRKVEEEIAIRYSEEKMRCPTHLSIGQEAVSAAYSLAIKKTDFAVSSHRSHLHYLAKGGNLNSLIAEIYGKKTGCSKGKGGSMHLIDLNVNFMGSSAIVGNSIPVGVGLGLSIKLNKTKQISTVFLGDGAVEEGVFYESVNFAALKHLPILFICENNLYSVYSPKKVRQPERRSISQMVKSIGISSSKCDGNDVIKCYEHIQKQINKIRLNGGPQFIEFSTYRHREHCGPNFDNQLGYRNKKEINFWKLRDPLLKIKDKVDTETISKNEKKINFLIKNAFIFAENSPFPNEKEAYKGLYA